MKKISLLLLLLLFATSLSVYGQLAQEEAEPVQEEEGLRGWYVGIESLRLMESLLYTIYADDDLIYKQLYAFEAISYYQGKGIWRPGIRVGYIWLEDKQDFSSAQRNRRSIISRGGYIKLGTDVLISHREKENHALGLHGVLSYGKEDYNFRVGNEFFGFKEVLYRQNTWVPALELRYTYSQVLARKFNYQLGAYVTAFDWGSKELQAYRNLPGLNYSVGVFFHILYQVRSDF